jgi:hypothetical protein
MGPLKLVPGQPPLGSPGSGAVTVNLDTGQGVPPAAGAPVSSSDPTTPPATTNPTSGDGSTTGSTGSTGTSQGWLAALQGQEQAAQAQAASQAIADEYTDAGNAADAQAGYPSATPTSQPTSPSRFADTGTTPVGSVLSGGGALGVTGTPEPAGGDKPWVTVPVDKVIVSQSGSAQIRPLAATAQGYRSGKGQSIPSVHRAAALPTPPAGNVHPTQAPG